MERMHVLINFRSASYSCSWAYQIIYSLVHGVHLRAPCICRDEKSMRRLDKKWLDEK